MVHVWQTIHSPQVSHIFWVWQNISNLQELNLIFLPSPSPPPLSIQQVEPFLCDCVTISKCLAQAIEPFSQEICETKNLEETEKVLHKHKLKKRRTYDRLQIDQLTTEGLKINRLIKQESEERYYLTLMWLSHDHHMTITCLSHCRRSSIQSNPEFLSTITTLSKLVSNIETVKERLDEMWTTRGEKLEATYKQQTFEKEANQVMSCFTSSLSILPQCVLI